MNKLFGYLQTYEDACLIVHAVRLRYLSAIEGRLTAEERKDIKSGDIFCFIESKGGMKRWTDGKIWSPSKIHGQFLLYREVPRHMNKSAIGKRNRQRFLSGMDGCRSREKVIDWGDKLSLNKKTISISLQNKAYHVIAYFRPMFSRVPLMAIPLFNRMDLALKTHPELLCDRFLGSMIDRADFYSMFGLPAPSRQVIFPEVKRHVLERIATGVLAEWMQLRVTDSDSEGS